MHRKIASLLDRIMNDLADNKNRKSVILTGATGFVGSALIPILLEKNYKILALSRNPEKARAFSWYNKVDFVKYDIGDETLPQFENYNGLIHLAWDGLPNYESFHHIDFNLYQSFNFIKKIVTNGISQVLVAGTCFEYGNQFGPLDSGMKTNPNNNYGIAKDSLRKFLEQYSKLDGVDFELQWTRLFYLYGEGQRQNSLLSNLNKAIKDRECTFDLTSGEQLLDFLPVCEAAKQIVDIFASGDTGNYNICDGKPTSVRKMAEEVVSKNNSKIKLNFGALPSRNYESKAFWGIRDVPETMFLPSIPNAPTKERDENARLCPIRLRYNENLKFLENSAFDENLINYEVDYENSQAFSETFSVHMQNVLDLMKSILQKGSKLVEVGCGKGDFVELVQRDKYFTIDGYDASYEGNNSAITKRYLDKNDRIKADMVVLRHVLEHVPRPHEFLEMLAKVFGSSKIFIEVPNYEWIETNQTFFDVTFEHVNYFTPTSLKKMFKSGEFTHGLIFSEQYQFLMGNLLSLSVGFDESYRNGRWHFKSFADLFPEMDRKIDYINDLAKGGSAYIWGAATKGCLFLTHCANNQKLVGKIKFAIDINPNKIGKFLPNLPIRIETKEKFFEQAKPNDILIISNPAYETEIRREINSKSLKNIQIVVL